MEKKRIKVDYEDGYFFVDEDEKEFLDNYKTLYSKLMNELKDDTRIETIIFGYDDDLRGNTIQIYTKRCTLFRPTLTFTDDHDNDNEVLFGTLSQWSRLKAPENEKEQYKGVFNGKKISFNREWGNYRFTDEECKALLEGKEISFTTTNKNGEEYVAKGKLEEQEYQGFKFFGFKANFDKPLPTEFNGHKFTKAEIKQLEKGETLFVEDLYSKKKNTYYKAYLTYTKTDGIKMEFGKK